MHSQRAHREVEGDPVLKSHEVALRRKGIPSRESTAGPHGLVGLPGVILSGS
jgi:hypothetical protein